MQIHELNNFTGTLGSGVYLAIDDGNDTGKISSQGLLAATEARIDNIIAGPAPSAEEIVDARLGDDGVTYPSLGDAIRDQFSDVKSDKLDIPIYIESVSLTLQDGYYTENGYTALSGFKSAKQAVTEGDTLLLTGSGNYFAFAYYFVDNNGDVISQATTAMELNDYEIVVPSGATFVEINNSGTNKTVGLKKKTYDRAYSIKDTIEAVAENAEDIASLEKTKCNNGYEYANQGLTPIGGIVSLGGSVVTGAPWSHCVYNITDLDNIKIKVSGSNFSEAYPLVVYLNSSDVGVGSVILTANTDYQNYSIDVSTIPSTATKIVVNNDTRISGDNSKPSVSIGTVINLEELNDSINPINYWKGKKIVWFGTSIPAGVVNAGDSGGNGAYPTRIGELLGATVYNESVGSSCVRAGNHNNVSESDPLGYAGMIAQNLVLSLSLSSSEKQTLFDEWDSKWSQIIPMAGNVDMSDGNKAYYKTTSWDVKLAKYLTGGSVGQVDLYVFDHGHNDHGYPYNGWSDVKTLPPTNDPANRTYFIGAMRFLIEKILSDNPRARIVFIGHYANDDHPPIAEAQEELASIWNFPLCKTWEKLGWTQNQITYGGVTKSIQQFYCPDGVHPSSDTTGKSLKLYAEALYPFIRDCR